MQIQKTNSYNQNSKVNFGMYIGRIEGLETACPNMSVNEINQFYRGLNKKLAHVEPEESPMTFILRRVDNDYVDCQVTGKGLHTFATSRLPEVSVESLFDHVMRFKDYQFHRKYK